MRAKAILCLAQVNRDIDREKEKEQKLVGHVPVPSAPLSPIPPEVIVLHIPEPPLPTGPTGEIAEYSLTDGRIGSTQF